jgi:hypothetical protein
MERNYIVIYVGGLLSHNLSGYRWKRIVLYSLVFVTVVMQHVSSCCLDELDKRKVE